MVIDPPDSPWQPQSYASAVHNASYWRLGSGRISQNVTITGSDSTLTVTVIAKNAPTAGDGTLVVGFSGGAVAESRSEIVISGQSYNTYTTTLPSPGSGTVSFYIYSVGFIDVDYACLREGTCKPGPCGISCADKRYSDTYIIHDGSFDADGGIVYAVTCTGLSIGVPFSVGCLNPVIETGFDSLYWQAQPGALQLTSLDGIAKTGYDTARALGLIASPIHRGTHQTTISDPALDPRTGARVGYNVVFRARRTYDNGTLTVNGKVINSSSMPDTWQDYSAWFQSGRDIAFNGSCSGVWCMGSATGFSAVVIDDVYVVPGPDMQCSRIISPSMSCLNPNPDFALLDQDWTLANGASISVNDATLPPGAYIQQYVPGVASGAAAGQYSALAESIVAGQSYIMAISAGGSGSGSGIVGASQPGSQAVVNISVDAANPSGVFTGSFTAAANMFNGDNFPIRVLASEGNSADLHIYSVCIKSSDAPITTTACLGQWLDHNNADPIGELISPPGYVANTINLNGSYALDVSGATELGATNIVIRYVNQNGEQDQLATLQVSSQFTETVTFVANAQGGMVVLYADKNIIYNKLCLRMDSSGSDGRIPGALPFPECPAYVLTMNKNLGNFFIQKPYSITNAYNGQIQPASYIGEMVYNYAIYPYVCTFIHVANTQYRQFADYVTRFELAMSNVLAKLDDIIALLQAILDKIPSVVVPTCGLLDMIASLFSLLLSMLLELLKLMFTLLRMLITALTAIITDVRGEDSIAYPINCSGNNEWICFGLSMVKAADGQISSTAGVGSVLNIIALMVVAILTFHLVMWGQGQFRNMAQPGSSDESTD